MRLAAWRIDNGSPIRAEVAAVALEKDFEEWIEHDPSLAVEGLRVVARQVALEGGRLDLLGLDPNGRWVLIEIKRGKLYRETLAQALDYASSITSMQNDKLSEIVQSYLIKKGQTLESHPAMAALAEPEDGDKRDVLVAVVGIGRDPSLDRLVGYLGDGFGVPIRVVSFEVFRVDHERQMLVREVTEADAAPQTEAQHSYSVDAVFARAAQSGAAARFRIVYDTALSHDLYARPYKRSIMYTPPSNKTRMLFTAWLTDDTGGLALYLSADAFAEFYPIDADAVRAALGPDGERPITNDVDAKAFALALDALFETLDRDNHD